MHNEVRRSIVHGDVVQVGELHLHDKEAPHPPLTSWRDRPDLTTDLEDLLHVQREAAETLPYRLLGVKQPELTRVYVQQSVRETERQDRPVPIADALARGKHLLITGEPGAGKSTLGQMYVQRLATEWLEPSADPPLPEPVMPLRIPAKALADDLPWSELLANAVRDRRLNSPLRSELFAQRALGARWLVFVDGLDEIAEPERRARVVDALVSRMRRGTDHRLVITTRPLPPDELQKLHGQDIDLFTIQPFGPVELREFASGWFRAQDPTRATQRAAEFVSQVHDGRLRELVRNPLLATIAAIANTLEPHRKLPHNRADLYERFMTYLLEDKASGRTPLAELRKAHADDPARVERIERLYSARIDLVENAATHRLESEVPLLRTASLWATHRVNEEDVLAVVASTGVFVHDEKGLRFLHHSFAEFFAARVRARSIPADFPDLDEWVELGTQAAREGWVLFTFALWGREDGHDLDLVIERLLDGGVKHALLAGRLLAEDVAITPARAAEVVNRLVKLILANGVREIPWQDALKIGSVLAGLDNEDIAGLLIPKLRAMRDNTDFPPVVRIGCAVALGHLDSPEFAAKWLRDHADVRDTNALTAIATGLAEILPNGAELAQELLLRLITATDSYLIRVDVVSILLFDLERGEAAAVVLRDLVRRLRADTSIKPGSPHLPHSGALPDTSPIAWGTIASLARSLECRDEALWAAERALAMSSVDDDEFGAAADAVLAYGGKARLDALVARAQSLTLQHVLIVGEKTNAVLDLDEYVARHPAATDEQFVRACLSMVAMDPRQVQELVEHRSSLGPADLVELASAIASHDVVIEEELLARALSMRAENRQEFQKLVSGVLAIEGDVLGRVRDPGEVLAAARTPEQRAVAAPLLFQAGYPSESAGLVDGLLTWPFNAEAAVICLDGMTVKSVLEQAQALFDRLLDVVGHHPPDIARQFAPILHRIGRSADAAAVAIDAFLRSLGGQEVFEYAAVVLDVSGGANADFIVAKVRESNLSVWHRMDIADLFVNEGLLDHAVMLWLDVVHFHGTAVDKGIDAADKLVKVGQRAQAIEAAQDAKLRAWLEA